jgi:hypothetical protein
MKRTVFVLANVLLVFVAVFALFVLRPVQTVKAGRGCSNASLRGNYKLVMRGSFLLEEDDEGWPFPGDYSMLAYFDGYGDLSATDLFITSPFSGLSGPDSFTGGYYYVKPDCSVCLFFPEDVEEFFDYPVNLNGTLTDTGGDEARGTGYFGYSTSPWSGTFQATKIHEGWWNFFE